MKPIHLPTIHRPKQGAQSPVASLRAQTADLFKHVDTGKRRSCGDCTACCTVLKVNDLPPEGKDSYCDCPHQRKTRKKGRRPGCKIYDNRPPSCVGYECYWLGGLFRQRDRPDKLGMIVDSSDGALVGLSNLAGFPVVTVRETWDGAWRSKDYKRALEGLASRVGVLYRGGGPWPLLMAPSAAMEERLFAASAALDTWGELTNAHREGAHEAHVDDCPLCEGRCPVHANDERIGGFWPDCGVCRDAILAKAQRERDTSNS